MNIFDYIRPAGTSIVPPQAPAPTQGQQSGMLAALLRGPTQTVMSSDNQADPNWRDRARWQASNINSLPGVMSPNSMTADRLQNAQNMTPFNLQSQPQTVAIMQLLRGILPQSDFERLKAIGGPYLQSDDAFSQVFGTARDGSAYSAPRIDTASFGGFPQQAAADRFMYSSGGE